jgi:nucleoside-diphosphate kinase
MDNLIHASATPDEAEREIKLWFKPNDIPPLLRAYPSDISDTLYYFHKDRLWPTYEPGSVCLLAPGDIAWTSDLEALRLIRDGLPSPCSLGTVAAKYLINEERGDEAAATGRLSLP